MTSIGAPHGRVRVRRAGRRCRQLLAVLLVALAVLKLEQLARIDMATAARGDVHYARVWLSVWIRLVAISLFTLGYAIGGVLVDGLGVRTVVALVLILWCGLVAFGGVTDPAAYGMCAGLATSLMPGILTTASLAAVRMSMATRRRGPAIALLGIAAGYAWSPAYPFGLYQSIFGHPSAEDPMGWTFPMFALATVGTFIVMIWLWAFPETDAAAGLDLRPAQGRSSAVALRDAAHLLGDPLVWGLAAIQFCGIFVFTHALDQTWSFELLAYGRVEKPVIVTIFTVPLASLVFAGLSDWTFRKTRRFVRARRPFITVGFLVGGFAPLAAAAAARDNLQATFIAALGLAAVSVANLLSVDLAPRRMAGTYIGVVLTLSTSAHTLVQLALATRALPREWMPALVCLAAAVGAAASAILLPATRPPDDAEENQAQLARYF